MNCIRYMKGFLVVLFVSFFAMALAVPPRKKPRLFVLDASLLQQHKAHINGTGKAAYLQLLQDADEALQWGPHSVMEKRGIPPSGSKHDFMSLAPYFWPNPNTTNGLPYINKDGQVNPEVRNYLDKEYLPVLCDDIYKLALAYYFSGKDEYATHASQLLRMWFLDTATRMNPNLQYAQAVKGINEGRGYGLIETRHFVKVIDAIGLLQNAKSWTAADQAGMRDWFSRFLNWMQTSKNGQDEMHAANNHGTFYDAQRLSMAMFIDSTQLAKTIVSSALSRLDKQVAPDGSFPLELERTIALHYSVFTLEAYYQIAMMADKLGLPFWKAVTPSGKSLQMAFSYLKPYLAAEKEWTGQQIKPFDFDEAFPLLIISQKKYDCTDCAAAVQKIASEKVPQLLSNLLY